MTSHDTTFSDLPFRLWHAIDRAVDHLTVTQTAAIGGAGSGTAITASVAADQVNAWLQAASLGLGTAVGLGSLGLVILKLVQQRREMAQQAREDRHWAKNNPDHT